MCTIAKHLLGVSLADMKVYTTTVCLFFQMVSVHSLVVKMMHGM